MSINTLKKNSFKAGLLFIYFTLGALAALAYPQFTGYSEVGYYRETQEVYGYSMTYTNYDAAVYYDPEVRAKLFKMPEEIILDEGTDVGFSCAPCSPTSYQVAAEVVNESTNFQWNTQYSEISKHYFKAYRAYSAPQNQFYDPWGYSLWGSYFSNPGQYQYPWYQFFNFQPYIVNGPSQLVGTLQVNITTRPPVITQITPSAGLLGTSPNVQITGTGFGYGWEDGQTVNVSGNGVSAQVSSYLTNGLSVNFQIADNAETGDHQVTVTAGGVTSNVATFRVGDRSPQVSGIDPEDGFTGQNVPVTITGSGFGVNPTIEFSGSGITAIVNQGTSTSTEIHAVFSIAGNTYEGDRTVTVKSNGRLGFGFASVPGNSPTSNSLAFGVKKPKVIIPNIGSVEKGAVRTIMVKIQNAPAQNHVTKFRFKNQPAPPNPCPADGCKTGEARFVDDSNNDVTEISISGTGEDEVQTPIRIRGWERSSSNDNVKLEARFNNDSDVKDDRSFSVASVEFIEEDNCTGYDDIDFKNENQYSGRHFYVPYNGNNRLKARVSPSGASGNFNLTTGDAGITISPSSITSTNSTIVTVSASSAATRHPAVDIKSSNPSNLTRYAESLNLEVLRPKNFNVVLHAVTEDNDDVRAIPTGNGQPNQIAYTFTPGADNTINTVAQGDDVLVTAAPGQRPPPLYDPRTRRLMTGNNGILETSIGGDDEMYQSKDPVLMERFSPITTVGFGTPDRICITSGANQFIDSIRTGDDTDDFDPTNALPVIKAGPNGNCNTSTNDNDIAPPTMPSVSDVQNHLNNTTWGRQANIHFTVTRGTDFPVNFDLNRDGKLEFQEAAPGSAESIAIQNANNAANAFDLYFVGMTINDPTVATGLTVAAFASPNYGGTGWFSNLGLDTHTTSHEVGHILGRRGHSPEADIFKLDLMYPTGFPALNQCRVRNPDWNLVNP